MIKKHIFLLIAAVGVPVLLLGSIITERVGIWDYFLGLNEVEKVASRFETSYAEGVDRQIGPDEPAWKPILNLIDRYSGAKFPTDRKPRCFVRHQAIWSNKIDLGNGRIAEWTAPSTPIAIIFVEPLTPMKNEDVLIVGSIGDIRRWVDMRRADLRFVINDVMLGFTAVLFGFLLWSMDIKKIK